jgi:phosphoglycerate kinase
VRSLLKMVDLSIREKRLLIREDLNVPMENGRITSDQRILAALPTIKFALHHHAKIILMSHLGNPREGAFDQEFSLSSVAARLSELLNKPVRLIRDWQSGVDLRNDQVALLENVRFNVGEKANDIELAKKLASLGDIFVMDAFASAHRAHASTEGVARFAPIACAGPLLVRELDVLGNALEHPERPMLAIVGGAKVSGKVEVLESLAKRVDQLIVGGGIANTFIAASGHSVGLSLYDSDFLPTAIKLLATGKIPIPTDVVVADHFGRDAKPVVKAVNKVKDNEMILDVGPQTATHYAELVSQAKTIVWNGPIGVFEWPQFANGTEKLAHAVADSTAFSIVGGGDTIAAIDHFKVKDKISYVCTGGGAFLQFLEQTPLPGVTVLQQRFDKTSLEKEKSK